jgi:hypothetical protein
VNAWELLFHRFDLVRLQRQDNYCSWKGIFTGTVYLLYVNKGWFLINPFRNYIPKTAMWTRPLIEPYLISVAKNIRLSSNQKDTLETNSWNSTIEEIQPYSSSTYSKNIQLSFNENDDINTSPSQGKSTK